MRTKVLSFVSVALAAAGAAIAGASTGACSSSNDCPLGTEACGCAMGGVCSAGLTCYGQPAPTNGICLSPIKGLGGGGGAAAGGSSAGGSGAGGSTKDSGSGDVSHGSGGVGGSGGSASGGSGGASGGAGGSGDSGGGGAGGTSDSGGGGAGGAGGASNGNLITNGDFSNGSTDWQTQDGSGTINVSGGQLCVTGINTSVLLTWPVGGNGAALTGGASYTFTYSAMATVPLTVDAKVGETNSPYTADFDTPSGSDAVTTSFMTFTHMFTESSSGDTSAGVAFTLAQGPTNVPSGETQVCFQNISLVQN